MVGGRLGELLLAQKLISERELAAALSLQDDVGGSLGVLLIRMGAISEDQLLSVLSRQLNLPVLTAEAAPAPDRISRFFADVGSPISWWMDHQAIAWRADEDDGAAVVCAAAQPLDPALRDRLAQAAGSDIQYRLAPRALVIGLLEELTRGSKTAAEGVADAARLRELAQETPVIDYVNAIFAEAMSRRASDVHIEPFEDRFSVRMRVDGMLQTVRTGPRSGFDAVCSRIKLLSGMDIGERRLPQDGRQSIRVAGQELDLRVSTLPSAWGESVVLRLLGKSSRLPELKELGLHDDQASQLLRLVERPNGVVLVTGPTGSGKTTTIYRLLAHLNDGVRKIVTVEDPVEFDLPGVVQVQVRADIGLTFAAGLRSILRQDPDVIMVGEIRDPETARIAVQAALTGHLVISTVHTNSALSAIARLVDLGVEDYLLADVMRGAVGQRLVRRLCPHCARPSDERQAVTYEAARPEFLAASLRAPPQWMEAVGCERCTSTGYLGRVGLYEIAHSSLDMERDIRQRVSEDQLRRTARQDGFLTLFEDGYGKARDGQTTLAEVRRVSSGQGQADEAHSPMPSRVG